MGADTNRVALRIVKESTPGVTPSNPAFQALRITGTPSLAFTPKTVTTNEIREDAQVTDLILVGAEAGGDIGFELGPSALDTVFESSLRTTWVRRNNRTGSQITGISSNVITVLTGDAFSVSNLIALHGFGDANDGLIFPAVTTTNATTITAASGLTDNASPPDSAEVRNVGVQGASGDIETATGPNRITSTSLDFTTLGLTVGQWIKPGGNATANKFNTAGVNDWVRISGITANALTLDVVPSAWAADAGVGKTIWLFFGDYLTNGTTLSQFSVEREFTDITVFQYFTGNGFNTLGLNLQAESIVTVSSGLVGFSGSNATSRFAGATTIAAPTDTPFNTSSNIGRIGRNGTPIGSPNFITEATLAITNNLRRRTAVGNLGAVGLGTGEFGVTGTLNTFFGNKDLIDDVINNTETSLDFRFEGATNVSTNKKVVLFDLPRVKYSAGSPQVPGKNQDVTQNLGFQSIRHKTLGYTTLIQQFHGIQTS